MRKIIVVSLPKCGTNLIAGLFKTIGYAVTGEGIDNVWPAWCERLDATFITAFPDDTCCFFHSLNAEKLSMYLVQAWRQRDEPRIIFNYRDPRAALVSMINYLLGPRYSGAAWQQIGADILRALPGERRVPFAMNYLRATLFKDFRESAWLLDHPRVLRVSFEQLVGPEGGGSRDGQVDEVHRILEFAGIDGDASPIAERLFDRQSRTFSSGTIDGWRACFGAPELQQFDAMYHDILDAYGYARPQP